jgi:hypothetical protein
VGRVQPDAARLAQGIIREPMGTGGTGQAREAAKLLLRHTAADLELRGEKDRRRLRAQCPNRVWGSRLAALLGQLTANRPDASRRGPALPCPADWWDPFQGVSKWPANLSHAMIPTRA